MSLIGARAMTTGSDQLKKLADALRCVKCGRRPRLGALSRCRECLKADAAPDLAAYDMKVAAGAIAKTRERPTSPRSRKLQEAPPGVAGRQRPSAPRPAAAASTRVTQATAPKAPKAPTDRDWKAKVTDWMKRVFGANDPSVQRRVAERDLGGDLLEEHVGHYNLVYGGTHGAPHLRMYANSDAALTVIGAVVKRTLPRVRENDPIGNDGAPIDNRTLCPFCQARVRMPCSASRSNACPNRSRGNR